MSDVTPPPSDQPEASTPPPAYGTPAPPPYGAAPPGPAVPYAEWPQRALATLIDFAPIVGIVVVEMILVAIMPTAIDILVWLLALAGSLGWVVYNYGMQQGETGYTLGKGIVGIKLIGEQTGLPVGVGMAVARYFVHIIDGLPCYLGYLWPLWDAKKQTFTDKVLTHIVVQAPKQ